MRSFGSWSIVLFCLLCLLWGPDSADGCSEACQSATHIIQGYTAVQEELHQCLTHGVQGQLNHCNYTDDSELRCHIKYKGANSTLHKYYDFCDRVAGKIIFRELDINHNYLGLLTFNVTMEGIPQCVGNICNEDDIEPDDLFNPVFTDFIAEYEGGDLCEGADGSLGKLGFWDSFGVEIASWMGVDLADCFESSNGEEDSENVDEEDDSDVDEKYVFLPILVEFSRQIVSHLLFCLFPYL